MGSGKAKGVLNCISILFHGITKFPKAIKRLVVVEPDCIHKDKYLVHKLVVKLQKDNLKTMLARSKSTWYCHWDYTPQQFE
jgi:hypothetical protein